MRKLVLFILPLFTACIQVPLLDPASEPRASTVVPTIRSSISTPVAKPAKGAVLPPAITRVDVAGITFEGISFHSATHRLAVIDQPGGPGSRFPDARSAAGSRGAIAAINAGFFTPEGFPLGKLVSGGKSAGSWNKASSLGSGIFLESPSGNLAIARREAISPTAPQRELLQAGPMLVDNGKPVPGLNADKPAARIFILWNGGSRWWIGRASICTLAELANALGQASPAGFPIRRALNLDGGRSADLWISENVPGGPILHRPPFNRPVRNFLALITR